MTLSVMKEILQFFFLNRKILRCYKVDDYKKNQKSEEEQGVKWKRKFSIFYLGFFGAKILYYKKA